MLQKLIFLNVTSPMQIGMSLLKKLIIFTKFSPLNLTKIAFRLLLIIKYKSQCNLWSSRILRNDQRIIIKKKCKKNRVKKFTNIWHSQDTLQRKSSPKSQINPKKHKTHPKMSHSKRKKLKNTKIKIILFKFLSYIIITYYQLPSI